MKDGSDAIADWPILNALLNTASGASWVSFHHGGGVGIGNSLHAGQVIVADGTPEMRVRLERVLTNDPGHRRRAPRGRRLRDRDRARRARTGNRSADAARRREARRRESLPCSQPASSPGTSPLVPRASTRGSRARRRPVLVHFEVTLRCNARCGFCDYWKTDRIGARHRADRASPTPRASSIRCSSPSPAASRRCGATSRSSSRRWTARSALKYITLITHGGMLTAERAQSLWDAGVNQFNISLDYLDERHDRARGIPGLTAKIFAAVPAMRARGIDGIRFNTVIKNDNLDQIMPIVRRAAELGVGVNFSVYTDAKNGNREHLIAGDALARARRRRSRRAARLQAPPARRDHQLRLLPRADSALSCAARCASRAAPGIRTIHIDPDRPREALPRLPDRLSLARLSRYEPIELQRLLLRLPRRSAGAAPAVARPGRDGVSDRCRRRVPALRQRRAGRDVCRRRRARAAAPR